MDADKTLPKPQEDLPLPEKELESPHDMQLRAPSFFEKFPAKKWLFIIIAIILAIGVTAYAFTLGSSKKEEALQPTPTASISPTLLPLSPTQKPTLSPTCTPRPACLDANPRCLIPETPEMCPKK